MKYTYIYLMFFGFIVTSRCVSYYADLEKFEKRSLLRKFIIVHTGVQWYSWLKPFNVSLWLMILGTCNVVLLVIWWLDRKSPTGYYRILRESNEDGFTMLGE